MKQFLLTMAGVMAGMTIFFVSHEMAFVREVSSKVFFMDKGHVVVFANNPIWRGETQGSYFLVFNAILNHDHLDAGRKLDEK